MEVMFLTFEIDTLSLKTVLETKLFMLLRYLRNSYWESNNTSEHFSHLGKYLS